MAKIHQVKVRMPQRLHNQLVRDADRSGQTVNAEILRRLEESYADNTLKDRLDTLAEDVRRMNEEHRTQLHELIRRGFSTDTDTPTTPHKDAPRSEKELKS